MALSSTLLASDVDWRVRDVVCTSGPCDRSYVEQHGNVGIALVTHGSVQYRTAQGVPDNPHAWLVSAGRFRSIDQLRRLRRFETFDPLTHDAPAEQSRFDDEPVRDDRLRLIFTCCHPALAPDAQVALTLREVCGLTTEQIARAANASPRRPWSRSPPPPRCACATDGCR